MRISPAALLAAVVLCSCSTARADSDIPLSTERHPCVFVERARSDDHSEAVARARLQQGLDRIRSIKSDAEGDPVRYLGDTGITCKKEDTDILPRVICTVLVTVEVTLVGPCGKTRVRDTEVRL